MLFGIVKIGPGQQRVEQFTEAADAVTALVLFVEEQAPALEPSEFFVFVPGWEGGYLRPPPGHLWFYDFTEAAVVSAKPLPEIRNSILVFNALGGQTFTGKSTKVLLDAHALPPTSLVPSSFALSSGGLAVAEEGIYSVAVSATFDTTSNRSSASSVNFWLEVDGKEIEGARARTRAYQSGDGDTGSFALPVHLGAGDTLEVFAKRTKGSGTILTVDRGARLSVVRNTEG